MKLSLRSWGKIGRTEFMCARLRIEMLCHIILVLFCFITFRSYCSAFKSGWEMPGKSFQVDVLCLAPMPKYGSLIPKSTPVLSWCGNWSHYFRLLEENILRGKKTVVIVSTSLFHQRDFLAPIEGSTGNFPGVRWLVISDRKKSMGREAQVCTIDREGSNGGWEFARSRTLHCEPPEKADQLMGVRRFVSAPVNRVLWKRFRQAQHKIARFADDVYHETTCTTPFSQALSVINASVQYVSIKYPGWIATFAEHRMEALDAFVAYDLLRSRHFHFTGTTTISHVVLYVKKKFKLSVDVASWKAGKTTLLVTAASACTVLAFFSFISWSTEKLLLRDVPRVLSALLASVVSFPALFPLSCMSRPSGRLVLALWVFSMMCLSNYIQALLTTSVSAGMKLDLDDTREKLSPKLKSKQIRVCAVFGSYASTLLSGGHSETEFARDMRLALDFVYPERLSFKGYRMPGCLERVSKGTHMFLTQADIGCSPDIVEKYAFAKENFAMRVVTFAVRKESLFKAEFEYLTGRTFETGWALHVCLPYLSGKVCYPALKHFSAYIRLVPQQLLTLYMHCIFIAFVVLLLEILVSGTFITFPCV